MPTKRKKHTKCNKEFDAFLTEIPRLVNLMESEWGKWFALSNHTTEILSSMFSFSVSTQDLFTNIGKIVMTDFEKYIYFNSVICGQSSYMLSFMPESV